MSENKTELKLPYVIDIEDKSFNSLNELNTFLTSTNRASTLIQDFSTIKFTQDSVGKLQLDFGKGKFRFTDNGFNRLCKLLKVPSKYIEKIPFENQTKDLLVSLHSSNHKQLNFITKNDLLVGVSAKEELLTARELIDKIESFKFINNFREILLNSDRITISFTSDVVCPVSSDVFDIGLTIDHDGSSEEYPELSHYFFRQICSNGMKTRTLEKVAKFSNRLTKEKMFAILEPKINTSLETIQATIASSIQKMTTTEVNKDDKRYLKQYLAKKLMFSTYEKGYEQFDKEIGTKDPCTYYDLLNFITSFAKSAEILDDKNKMEYLGGDMLSHFKSFHPSREALKGYNSFKEEQIYKEKIES